MNIDIKQILAVTIPILAIILPVATCDVLQEQERTRQIEHYLGAGMTAADIRCSSRRTHMTEAERSACDLFMMGKKQ